MPVDHHLHLQSARAPLTNVPLCLAVLSAHDVVEDAPHREDVPHLVTVQTASRRRVGR